MSHNLFSFLQGKSNENKPLHFNRAKHNQLQLAVSPDTPNYFRLQNSKICPLLRDTT